MQHPPPKEGGENGALTESIFCQAAIAVNGLTLSLVYANVHGKNVHLNDCQYALLNVMVRTLT
jgi:hypothetical protein